MEEEGIGLVLARATELRLKISNCVHRATTDSAAPPPGEKQEDGEVNEAEEGEEAERLFNICDALETLESQLSSLQAMQQNHRYEREAALAEIEYSRKMLLDKLKEYKGEELEVIQEASAFVGETVEHNNDLLLPPYPSRPPLHLSSFSPRKAVRNGLISSDLTNELKKNVNEIEKNKEQSGSRNQGLRLGHFIGSAAKTVATLVGMMSILSLAGFGAKSETRNGPFKHLGLFLRQVVRSSEGGVQCPPGKVLVVENGQPRCLVKERVEVPFESVVATSDVNYGCG
ncbi:hypothetical protein BT93_I1464 [Corymbia citriodora subsp. variegata]|nr:hypothetical protein BT93_I1464 [Corymbia citriodora subsp. variegata]